MPNGGLWFGENLKNAGPIAEKVTLLASAARTDNGTAIVSGFAPFSSAVFTLTVTAKDTEVGDTLNVYIQRELPNGEWDDLVSFTQMLGNGTDADTDLADVYAGASSGAYSATVSDAGLAAGSVRNLMWGNRLRVKWVIADAGTDNASFTFAVHGSLRV